MCLLEKVEIYVCVWGERERERERERGDHWVFVKGWKNSVYYFHFHETKQNL